MATLLKNWQTRAEIEIGLWISEQTSLFTVITHDLRYNTRSDYQYFRDVQEAIKEGARRARLYYFYQ